MVENLDGDFSLTLNTITAIDELGLSLQLNLMSDSTSGGGGPVDIGSQVTVHPLCGDIGVDLHGMRTAVVGSSAHSHVGEGKRLFDEIIRVYGAQKVDGKINGTCAQNKGALCRCELQG